jgi:hypothetical protein
MSVNNWMVIIYMATSAVIGGGDVAVTWAVRSYYSIHKMIRDKQLL